MVDILENYKFDLGDKGLRNCQITVNCLSIIFRLDNNHWKNKAANAPITFEKIRELSML